MLAYLPAIYHNYVVRQVLRGFNR